VVVDKEEQMGVRISQVDAFTDKAFRGNPAAVCVLDQPQSEQWMQALAQEMNLSETAFLHPEADGYRLRWFTPTVEVDLCGHATLASAHVLWESGELARERKAHFHTRRGLLTARQSGEWIELDFPAKRERTIEVPTGLLEALGVHARYVGKNQFDYLVEVDTEAEVRALLPGTLLGRAPRQAGAAGLPGITARRSGPRAAGGGPGATRRAGSHRAAR
jgi:predicted PhzF superfamily epimerase YddE/YHI9